MKTLIIGLGNPILGDDGVGWVVAEKVQAELINPQSAIENPQSVEVDCASLGGLSLMERLTGSERVILVDAIFTGKQPVGTVSRFLLDELPDLSAGHSASAHDTSLRNALICRYLCQMTKTSPSLPSRLKPSMISARNYPRPLPPPSHSLCNRCSIC